MNPAEMTGARTSSLSVADVMTRSPLECHPDDHLLDIAARMQQHRIRHIPVVDGNHRVLGIVSDRDVRNAIGDPAAWLERPSTRLEDLRVAGAMTEPAVTIAPDAPLGDAIRRLVELEVGALPVVGADGALAGLVSYIDVLRALRPGGGAAATAPRH
jgi:CBS domain-containing protein